jgi:uncharacterized protein (TIGR02588 family)
MKVEKNGLEWAVFATSLVLVVVILAALLVDAAGSGRQPPVLVVRLEAPERVGGMFRVPLEVENRGDTTAEQCTVEVVLRAGAEVVERAEVEFAFVPRGSSRRGWVTLRHDPACCELLARPLGFRAP